MMGDWTFFSNHGHVLVCLARDSDARLRDVALQVGITERAVQKIVRDLQDEGYLEISKHGRRNRYRINKRKALRHSLQSGCTVGQLLALLSKAEKTPKAEPARPVQQEVSAPPPSSQPSEQPLPEPVETRDTEAESPESEPSGEPPPDSKSDADRGREEKTDLEQGRLF
jgi:predicted ArsR family transcriptional regulator